METKHTPGAWEISFEAPRWIVQADMGVGKRAVAYLVGDYVTCAPNARLIAAAPELLDVLERAVALSDRLCDEQGWERREDAQQMRDEMAAVVAKARSQ